MITQNPQNSLNAPSPEEIDDLIACDLLGKLTPDEQARLDALRQNDPAIESLYQETRMTHHLLETDSRAAMPDPNFEQRILSGVKQKLEPPSKAKQKQGRLAFLYRWIFNPIRGPGIIGGAFVLLLLIMSIKSGFTSLSYTGGLDPTKAAELYQASVTQQYQDEMEDFQKSNEKVKKDSTDASRQLFGMRKVAGEDEGQRVYDRPSSVALKAVPASPDQAKSLDQNSLAQSESADAPAPMVAAAAPGSAGAMQKMPVPEPQMDSAVAPPPPPQAPGEAPVPAPATSTQADNRSFAKTSPEAGATGGNAGNAVETKEQAAEDISRKLIRNASLELQVINYTETGDKINTLAKANGGYIDSTTSERGGNGKLQGTIVVKVKPEKLDDFLLQLRSLGTVENQAISTEDVTKDYYDVQARLLNAQKTEEQLQGLLSRNNGKVSELLAVEREMNRVRGDIESMQGQLKLYDFQVQFATVTITLEEKNMNQSARFLLKENDSLTLNTDDVETTFQASKTAVDDAKGQIVTAEINRSSPTQISAQIEASIPPDHIDAFLASLRGLGRVEGLQRHTDRVAQDGGDSDRPASDTTTEKDSVTVSLTIVLDYGGQDQVGLTLVTHNVEDIFEKAKKLALDNKATILESNLDKDQNGNSIASLQVRIPGNNYPAMLDFLRASGRIPYFNRTDHNTGANAEASLIRSGLGPVVLQISITDDEPAIQNSDISIVTDTVEEKVDAVKSSLAGFDATLKSSTFNQDPNGRAEAALVIKLPMKLYPKMSDSLKALGRVESFSISRQERPQPIPLSDADKNAIGAQPDEMAPAEIHLTLHSQPDIVPPDNGVWSTLRSAFSNSLSALGSSLIMVFVLVAALLPWLFLAGIVGLIVRLVFFGKKK